jgi:hypothetical protein
MATQRGTLSHNVSLAGLSFGGSIAREGEGVISQVVDLPAGKAGAISATGVDGLATGHGIVQTDVIDVHWSDPADSTYKCRRGLTVDTASANAVTFNETPAGTGDALPAEHTAVVIAKQVEIADIGFDGDNLVMLAMAADQRAAVDLHDAGGIELAVTMETSEGYSWADNLGTASPVAGDDIVSAVASNGTTTATVLYLAALLDSVA